MKSAAHKILVIVETDEKGLPTRLTLEILGLGKRLAVPTGGTVEAVLMGNDVEKGCRETASRGADKVFSFEHPGLSPYHPEIWQAVLEPLLRERETDLVLAGNTSLGQDLLPRLAFSIQAGLVTDCVDVRPVEDGFLFTKPIYGGNALAEIKVLTPVALATVRAGVGGALPPSGSGGKILAVSPDVQPETRIVVKEKQDLEIAECPLEEARVVVSGGRGIGGEEGFGVLRDLARLLGGAVGASRPPVDAGWVSPACQVGITGKTVAPDLYIAVAISGSSQHLSGMGGSGKIVAINKDPEAYIFRVSDYGVVGDWREVVPAFISTIEETMTT